MWLVEIVTWSKSVILRCSKNVIVAGASSSLRGRRSQPGLAETPINRLAGQATATSTRMNVSVARHAAPPREGPHGRRDRPGHPCRMFFGRVFFVDPFCPEEAGAQQADGGELTARADRMPGGTVAGRCAHRGLGKIRSQAGDDRQAAAE